MIEPSSSLWPSSVVLVKRRMKLVLRKVVLWPELITHWILLRCALFSTLDLKSGYWQDDLLLVTVRNIIGPVVFGSSQLCHLPFETYQ